jgi:hypothetical protein
MNFTRSGSSKSATILGIPAIALPIRR